MTRLHLDYETASELDLRKVGAHKYAAHPSTRILMLGWAFGEEEPCLWEPHRGPVPDRLAQALRDPSVTKYAYNAQFERLITRHCLGIEIPYDQMRCTMVAASYLGFAGGLDTTLRAIGLPHKDVRGGKLINLFCSPAPKNHHATWYDWTNRPDDWHDFGQYCIQDVKVERELHHFLCKFPKVLDWDWQQWYVDQRVNDRGVMLDTDMALSAARVWGLEKKALHDRMADLMGISKVTRDPFVEYFKQRYGIELENTTKDYLASVRKSLPEDAQDLLDLWAQKEAKAVSKYTAVVNVAGEDSRARGMFQYKGAARTDRAGGRLIQLQNLKRPFVDPEGIDTLVSAIKLEDPQFLTMLYGMPVSKILGGSIRHALMSKPGHSFVIADLSSIESVVLGWLTMCPLIDRTFRDGRDSYKVFASNYYGIPYEEVTKAQRSFSKPPVLGCGYMLGWRGLIAYAEGYGVAMEEDDAKKAVDIFRTMYPEIPAFWRWIYEAITYTCTTGNPVEGYRLKIERDSDFLRVWLPSGRALSYYKPEMQMRPAPWDPKQEILNFTYMGMTDKNQWDRIAAHAGGITENIVQSMAGDILWQGIMRAEKENIPVVVHVHDEICAEVPDEMAARALQVLIQCMIASLPWAPDMWLGAAGFITKRYTKD